MARQKIYNAKITIEMDDVETETVRFKEYAQAHEEEVIVANWYKITGSGPDGEKWTAKVRMHDTQGTIVESENCPMRDDQLKGLVSEVEQTLWKLI